MIKAGIIGGSGYTGGELLRLLLNHPQVNVDFVYSTTRAGKKVSTAHADLLGQTELSFSQQVNPEVDVVFLCLGHGNSSAFLKEHRFSTETKIIDLSNEFRLEADQQFKGNTFVYGLPELQKNKIAQASAIANPGCFATAIQLALLPLAQQKLLNNAVHVNAVTGSTGAGVSPSATTHFSWRTSNVSWYKPFTHQHLGEIGESLQQLSGAKAQLHFLPVRGNFSRGIFATAYTAFEGSFEDAVSLYKNFYSDHPFTQLADQPISLKQVVNTNQCHLHLIKHEGLLLITAALDNLLKGASGQAVQNMNLMFGLAENSGLSLKSSVF